ncbi:MAG: YCF48-related protein [Bacteroidales bacterium]|jgi:photosystem II stability/assembly factor-like uncharacterized protein
MKTFYRVVIFIIMIFLIVVCSNSLKSQSWYKVNSGSVRDLSAICFPTANTGYIAGFLAVLKTVDGGSTWLDITPQLNNFANSVFFNNADTGYLCEYDNNGHGDIVKTTDGGQTWTLSGSIPNGDLNLITFVSSQTGYVIGTDAGTDLGLIYKTNNAGSSWVNISPPGDIAEDLEYGCFLNADTGYACGFGSVVKTTDGGVTWTASMVGYQYSLECIYFPDPDTGYCAGYNTSTNKSAILKTVDGGTTWTDMGLTNWDRYLWSVWFADGHTGYTVGRNMLILKTTDGGSTWIQQSVANTDTTAGLNGTCFSDINHGWAVGTDGMLVETGSDAGINQLKSNAGMISIYPDPARVNIYLRNLKAGEGFSYDILDLTGNILIQGTAYNQNRGIDVSELTTGIYFLRVENGGTARTMKFVKL